MTASQFVTARVRTFSLALASTLGAISLSPGCAMQVDDGEDAFDEDSVGVAAEAIYNGWTPYTSEENPPIVCDGTAMFSAAQCNGRYCDNIRAHCTPTAGTRAPSSTWTSPFSEESPNYRYCPSGSWVTGLSCTGKYCDNISLQCSVFNNVSPHSCYWTGWFSEESSGYLNFGSGYFARGAQCDGRYCDNKRFYVCQL